MTITTRQQHWCEPCRAWTEHEREATLPPEYQCGDPDYEDRSRCGRCGEYYQCGECGAPWDVTAEKCEAILDHGYHGPEAELWQVIADGIPWEDGDGKSAWERREADSVAAHVETLGYAAEVTPA
jgi:hypothetical protein